MIILLSNVTKISSREILFITLFLYMYKRDEEEFYDNSSRSN